MKKITVPGVREEYELICDVTDKPAVSRLALRFGFYGGYRDLQTLQVDLCEEVAADVLKLLPSRYPQFQPAETDVVSACPMCDRG